jgi:uncharacterized protein (DUF1015 family)
MIQLRGFIFSDMDYQGNIFINKQNIHAPIFNGGIYMVEVKPFKGITYNKEKIKTLDKVMSPPYDIISDKMQEKLYNNDPYNFVRLILGKINSDDTDKNNRYTRAKKSFEEWMQQVILVQSEKEAIYPYRIEYTLKDEKRTMNGFFILLKLDKDYKLVKAHEKTLSKPKADRLNLMRACRANLEPIQLLYIDEKNRLQQSIQRNLTDAAMIRVKGYDSFYHSIWKITDKKLIDQIKETLDEQVLFIADGHHRYQTAINFATEMEKTTGNSDEDAPFHYRMVILANMFDEGLAILPTHRLMKLSIDKDEVITKLKEYFTVETSPRKTEEKNYNTLIDDIKDKLEATEDHKFAMLFKDTYYILTLNDKTAMDKLAQEHSETWRTLDVSILHKIIIEHILGITQDTLEDHVKYTREDEEAIQLVDDGTFDFSFLMNATKIDELKAIAEAGEHMPQKSTYFLPKMLSGLVIYKMEF